MRIQDYESYIASSISGSVARTPYLPDVNDFPAVCALRNSISRNHVGASQQEYVERFILRGYSYSSLEGAIEAAEALARSIEHYTSTFVYTYLFEIVTLGLGLTTQDAEALSTQQLFTLVTQSARYDGGRILRDARVLSVTTDEGFLAPYSLCEAEIEFSYDYTNTNINPYD